MKNGGGGIKKKEKVVRGRVSWKKAVKKKIRKQEVGGAKVKMEGKGRGSTFMGCSISRLDVLSRGNTSDFQSAPYCSAAVPFEPKQTDCSLFFAKWPGREVERKKRIMF